MQPVGDDARHVDGEAERGLPVTARVDADLDAVRLDVAIAAREPADDLGLLRAVDADVEVVAVVRDADDGALARRVAAHGELLREGVGGLGPAPHRVVEPAVEDWRLLGAHGPEVGSQRRRESQKRGKQGHQGSHGDQQQRTPVE